GSITKVVSDPTLDPTTSSQFAKQTYTLAGLTHDQQNDVIHTILNALTLTAKKTILEPGEVALLKILPRAMPNAPQAVTSVLDEAPSVEIRGAIPLDSLVEAIIGPITGALGRALPGSKTSLETA